MRLSLRRALAPVAVLAVLSTAACGGRDDNTALDQDSTLARDLARAGEDSAVQPELKDVPAAPPASAPETKSAPRTPARSQPRPTPPASQPAPTASAPAPTGGTEVSKGEVGGERAMGSIASGTVMNLSSTEKVCTNTNKVGDRFTATVDQAVVGNNGAVIPAGSKVVVEVTELHRSENTRDQIVMGFRIVSITAGSKTYYPEAEVTTAAIERVRASSQANDAKKVVGGAVAGAIIGQVIGKDRRGTLIGAAAGAAAGAGAAAATADYDGCVNTGAAISIRLTSNLTVAAGA